MDNNHRSHIDDEADPSPLQLTLPGLDPTDGIDPRFILDDETCRRGLRHIAAIRALLESRQNAA